jgi:hypothetical protein
VCDLTEKGKLDITTWESFVTSAACGKVDFLAYNYDQPEVAAVINRMQAFYRTLTDIQYPKNMNQSKDDFLASFKQRMIDYFSSLKSEERKRSVIKECFRLEYPLPESYKDNSKEAYRLLAGEHKRLLAGGKPNRLFTDEADSPTDEPIPEAYQAYLKKERRRIGEGI